ncbi:MAG: aldose 1-epimerase [Gemmataceae bacterium]
MTAHVTRSPHFVNGTEFDAYTLTAGDAVAKVWPTGFSLIHWSVGGREIVYCPPLDELVERPTRGGIPVLFPFPNRIRGGRFMVGATEYQLPLNDSTKQNAIHGFTPRVPWHAPEWCVEGDSHCWLRSTFDSTAVDDGRANWPGAYRLTLTIHLTPTSLRYVAQVENPGPTPLPFGLGYHPYFRTTPDSRLTTVARGRWDLQDNLPTGTVVPLDRLHDLREPRLVSGLMLDDGYTDLPLARGPREIARLIDSDGVLAVIADPNFRELVLFTPPHRQAIAIEPYTCPTDAVNLAAQGKDVGWRELGPSDTWTGNVEYKWIGEQEAGVVAAVGGSHPSLVARAEVRPEDGE